MKPYPAYKASGVEWLGEVPAGWEVVKLRYLAHFESGGTPSREKPEFWNGDIPWVSPKDMKARRICTSEELITEAGLLGSASKLTEIGAVLMVVRSGILRHTIPVALNDVPVAINQDVKAVTFPSGSVTPDYFAYFVEGHNDALILEWGKQGATVESIEQQYVSETCVPLPPLPEQRAIAGFLDREVGKIDALVAETRRLVALLSEKRQATISHAVTRGLNPAAPLRPSGIDWLGDIPEGWAVVPLKYLVTFSSGGTPSKDRLDYWDGELPWASAKDLKSDRLEDTLLHISEAAVNDGAATMEPAGSVLVLVRGMTLAKAFPVCLATVPMAINQDLKAIHCGPRISNEFLAHMLRGLENESLSRIDEAGHGTKALRMDAWTSMEVPVPPREEQEAIVVGIEATLSRLDALTAEANSAIALLLERRAALISAAVTGKIDVRGEAPAEVAAGGG